MLIIGSHLDNMPIMSLQTSAEIGRASEAIINPANLAIVAYRVSGPLVSRPDTYVLINDIRELSDVGFIVDSADEFINDGDVVAIDNVIQYGFQLIGRPVISKLRKKLGKVVDYNIDLDSFNIIQLTVKRPLLRSLSETELIIHRTQIVEINDTAIVVDDGAIRAEPVSSKVTGSYHNPFRGVKPAVESVTLSED